MTTDSLRRPAVSGATLSAPRVVTHRHLGDAVRVGIGLVALAITALLARHTNVPRLEIDLFRLINDLPSWALPPLWTVMQLGAIGAVAVASAVALAARRPGLARDLAVSGVLAYVLALQIKSLIGRARPDALLSEVMLRTEQGGLGFVSGHAAVAAAMAAAAAPWLPRPWRRAAWAAAALVAIARVFVGAHLVLDVLGGAALGWTVAAALHLLWGAPVHRAEAPQVRNALVAAGLHPIRVTPVALDARGSRPFMVTVHEDGADSELFVKVIGYHERNSDLLFKLFRHVIFREIEDESPFATPKQEVEHEAFLALLAQRAGVRTPDIVSVGVAENGDAWLAERFVPTRDLARIAVERLSDAVLDRLWGQVALLRAAGIAHRDLRLANILLDADDLPWIVDFGFGESGASPRRLNADVAELLVSTSLRVGPHRAVAAAYRTLGGAALQGAAPLLQPLALASATRSAARRSRGLLPQVRAAVGDIVGAEPAAPETMLRWRWRTLGWIAATVFATYVLLPQVSQYGRLVETLDDARWELLAGALAMSAVTYVAAAVALMGASPHPLAFGRTLDVQLAGSFANRLMPFGLGGTAVIERYLERCGSTRATALAVVALVTTSGAILHVVELVGAGVWLGRSRQFLDAALPSGWHALIGFVAVMTVLGTVVAVLLHRPEWLAQVREAGHALNRVTRNPRRATLLLGGQVCSNVAYATALGLAVYAFGANPSPALVAAVFLGGSALGAASPTPAGLGVVEAALVAGLMAGGVPGSAAVAGVLAYRIATFWLPAALGFFSFRALRRRNTL